MKTSLGLKNGQAISTGTCVNYCYRSKETGILMSSRGVVVDLDTTKGTVTIQDNDRTIITTKNRINYAMDRNHFPAGKRGLEKFRKDNITAYNKRRPNPKQLKDIQYEIGFIAGFNMPKKVFITELVEKIQIRFPKLDIDKQLVKEQINNLVELTNKKRTVFRYRTNKTSSYINCYTYAPGT